MRPHFLTKGVGSFAKDLESWSWCCSGCDSGSDSWLFAATPGVSDADYETLAFGIRDAIFPKSHYRHHTGTTEVGINTGILPACHGFYYSIDLINTGDLPTACRHYRHTYR